MGIHKVNVNKHIQSNKPFESVAYIKQNKKQSNKKLNSLSIKGIYQSLLIIRVDKCLRWPGHPYFAPFHLFIIF